MSDEVSRSLWGDGPDQTGGNPPGSSPTRRQGEAGVLGQLVRLFLLLLPALIVYALMPGAVPVESSAAVKDSAQIAAFTRLAIAALVAAVGLLFFVFGLPAATRGNRIIRVTVSFVAGGVILASIVFLAMGALDPQSAFSERLILPALVIVVSVVLAAFSPLMPIWLLNVPDNRVWMVLDSGDHLIAYVGPGQRWVRPIDGFAEFTEAGFFTIDIDSEEFVSQDYFPFRARVSVVCLYNPLHAAPENRIILRDLPRDTLRQELQKEIEFVIRHKLTDEQRQQMREPETFRSVLKTLAMDIREAVEARRGMGISLIPHNPINVFLEPTRLVTDSRQRLMSIEALAVGDRTLREFLELISQGGDVNLIIEPEGQIRLTLGAGAHVEIGDRLRDALTKAAHTLAESHRPQISPGPLVDQLGPGIPTQPSGGQTGGSQEQATRPVEPPETPPEQSTGVIELHLDDDGVYKPRRNPIIPLDLPEDGDSS
ncbi:MAG: hypothetical protein HPY64_00870 [Anaerolineae bacterium]|nr:hypothetical protein [Anaerolineae bacterium]